MDELVVIVTGYLEALFSVLEAMLTYCGSLLMAQGLIDSLIAEGGMLNGIANTIKPVAYTIVSICFVIEFIKITAEANILKWEYGLRVFAKLVLARVCIDIAPVALNTIYTTFVSWVGAANSSIAFDMTQLFTDLVQELNGLSFFSFFGFIMSEGLFFVAIIVLVILCMIVSLARVFELAIYFAISPIPCALMPLSDGTGSRITKKFFLSFSATCMSGLLMVICMRIYCEVMMFPYNYPILALIKGLFPTSIGILYDLLCLIILFIALSKCNSWAKTIMDVG